MVPLKEECCAVLQAVGRDPDSVAPDGSDVRLLLGLRGGGMAHFSLAPGRVSVAVHHRSVEEIWYFVGGEGEMWMRGVDDSPFLVGAGACIAIPVGTHFQFRSTGDVPLEAVGVTMPPWPGAGEAVRSPYQEWEPTVAPGPGPE